VQKLFWSLTALLLPIATYAQADAKVGGQLGGEYGLKAAAKNAKYKVDLDFTKALNGLIATAFGILGVLFLGMVIYGGFNWMTSMGDSEKVDAGKNTLVWAVTGLGVVIASYAISTFVISSIYG